MVPVCIYQYFQKEYFRTICRVENQQKVKLVRIELFKKFIDLIYDVYVFMIWKTIHNKKMLNRLSFLEQFQ